MKKKTIFELDCDDSECQYDNVAFLLFHSVAPSYAFVDDINKLYGLNLSRIEDMNLYGQQWPLFSDRDKMMKLDYYLVEKPLQANICEALWTSGHKLLIVKGDRSAAIVNTIHNEFCSINDEHDPADILAEEHALLLNNMRSSFTTTTCIDPSQPLPPSLSKKSQRDYNVLCNILEEVLDYIDIEII